MNNRTRDTRNILLVLALIAAFEIFRPAPGMTQPSMTNQMRDVIHELQGIKQELAKLERKMK